MIISAGNHWEAPCDFCQVVAQMLLEATASSHSHGYVFHSAEQVPKQQQ
jgi:hypothetical protein